MVLDIHSFKRESIPCYKQAVALNPMEFRWLYFGAIVLNETVSPEALEWFERSNKLDPNYAPLQLHYGQALFNTGHLEKAEKSFEQVVRLLTASSHGYLGLGKIFMARGNLQGSQTHLLKALDLDSKHREVHGVLAEVLRRLGKIDESAKELQIANQLPKIARIDDPLYEELVASRCLYHCSLPLPLVKVIIWFAIVPVKASVMPPGHSTSTLSTTVPSPRPKCALGSLLERKL